MAYLSAYCRPVFWVALFTLLTVTATAEAGGMRFIRDTEIENTLKIFSTPVFDQAGLSPETVQFILVDDTALNAFVAGGQNIFLHTGLILETSGPAELMGVIAHETGHISSGHIFRTQEAVDDISLQATIATILGIAAAIGSKSGDAGAATLSASQTFAQRLILRHSRVQESAADQAAVRFLKGSGLPLQGFLDFMRKLSSQELLPESQQSAYVRTHPLTRDRVDFLENITKDIETAPALNPRWHAQHLRMQAKLKGYLFPNRMLQDTSDTIAARYGRAIAHYRQDKIQAALDATEALIQEEPNNPYFHELKGQILFESGQIDAAIAPYGRAVALMPQAGLIRAAYGHALLQSQVKVAERRAEGIRQLQASLQTEPRQSRTHHLLAIGYGQSGREGYSRLHLAEEALLRGQPDLAEKNAKLAQTFLSANSAGYQRASDILAVIKIHRQKKN